MKSCCRCKKEKSYEEFGNLQSSKDGYAHRCKQCDRLATSAWRNIHKAAHKEMNRLWSINNKDKVRAKGLRYKKRHRGRLAQRQKEREAMKTQAKPFWFDIKEVEYIYNLASKRKLHVDHIVPLNSKKVCGLHVQDNLRCIPQKLNTYKGNRYWPSMWQED